MFLVHMDFHSWCTKSQHKISFTGKSFDGDVVTCHCGEDLLHCGKAIFLPSGTPIFELLVMYSLGFKAIINILAPFWPVCDRLLRFISESDTCQPIGN